MVKCKIQVLLVFRCERKREREKERKREREKERKREREKERKREREKERKREREKERKREREKERKGQIKLNCFLFVCKKNFYLVKNWMRLFRIILINFKILCVFQLAL